MNLQSFNNINNGFNPLQLSLPNIEERKAFLKDAKTFLDKRIAACYKEMEANLEKMFHNFENNTTIIDRFENHKSLLELFNQLDTVLSHPKGSNALIALNPVNELTNLLKQIQQIAKESLDPELQDDFKEFNHLYTSKNIVADTQTFFMQKNSEKVRKVKVLANKINLVTQRLQTEVAQTTEKTNKNNRNIVDTDFDKAHETSLYEEQSALISHDLEELEQGNSVVLKEFRLFEHKFPPNSFFGKIFTKLAYEFWKGEANKYCNANSHDFDIRKYRFCQKKIIKLSSQVGDDIINPRLSFLHHSKAPHNLECDRLKAEQRKTLDSDYKAYMESPEDDFPELPEEIQLDPLLAGVTAGVLKAEKAAAVKSKDMIGTLPVKGVLEYKHPVEIKLTSKHKKSGLSKYIEDLSKLSPSEQAKRHMQKRMLFFQALCRFIEDRRADFAGVTFPTNLDDQYTAKKYFTTNQNTGGFYQNAHISLIPKLAVVNGKGELKRVGKVDIVVQGNSIPLNHMLNACDFAPASINQIDALCEFAFRPLANEIFNGITATPPNMNAAGGNAQMTTEFRNFLETLKQALETKNLYLLNAWRGLPPKVLKHFDSVYANLLSDTSAVKYVNGMIAAL